MAPDVQILLSGTLTFGVPLALAVREILTLKPARRDGDRDDSLTPTPPLPTEGWEPPLKPLPACLVPVLNAPARAKVLERV